MGRETQTVEECRSAFASMGQEEWDAMMESSRFGAWLTPVEQEGLRLALLDRIAQREVEVNENFDAASRRLTSDREEAGGDD